MTLVSAFTVRRRLQNAGIFSFLIRSFSFQNGFSPGGIRCGVGFYLPLSNRMSNEVTADEDFKLYILETCFSIENSFISTQSIYRSYHSRGRFKQVDKQNR